MPISFLLWPGERFFSVVVIKLPISLFVEVDDGCIFELLRDYFLTIRQKRSVNFCSSLSPPCLYTSAGMASAPGDFPVESCLIDFFLARWSVEIRVFSTCGRRAIASALISAGLSRTALKCSTHLFRIAGLSVISVVPSTLNNGDVLDDCGP